MRRDADHRRLIGPGTLSHALLLAFLVVGCTASNRSDAPISTNLSISTYSLARERAGGARGSGYFFPLLEVYNDAGILIYSSHNSTNNGDMIRHFPQGLEGQEPQQKAPRLKNVLYEIPAFRESALALGRKKWTIISIELDGCEGCAIQGKVLQDAVPRLIHQQSVEIFEVHVSPH
jgi:hypothetical protein